MLTPTRALPAPNPQGSRLQPNISTRFGIILKHIGLVCVADVFFLSFCFVFFPYFPLSFYSIMVHIYINAGLHYQRWTQMLVSTRMHLKAEQRGSRCFISGASFASTRSTFYEEVTISVPRNVSMVINVWGLWRGSSTYLSSVADADIGDCCVTRLTTMAPEHASWFPSKCYQHCCSIVQSEPWWFGTLVLSINKHMYTIESQ